MYDGVKAMIEAERKLTALYTAGGHDVGGEAEAPAQIEAGPHLKDIS